MASNLDNFLKSFLEMLEIEMAKKNRELRAMGPERMVLGEFVKNAKLNGLELYQKHCEICHSIKHFEGECEQAESKAN